ncbi:MAG: winged helix-turn-helix transcriptional regulator [Candidatus Dormibacteria bacterium]
MTTSASSSPGWVAYVEPDDRRLRTRQQAAREAGLELVAFSSHEEFRAVAHAPAPAFIVCRPSDIPIPAAAYGAPLLALVDDPELSKVALRQGALGVLLEPADGELFSLVLRSHLKTVGEWRLLRQDIEQQHVAAGMIVSQAQRTVERNGVRHRLTPTEWRLFAFLLAHPEETHSRRAMAAGAWGDGYANREHQAEIYVWRLRRKIECDPALPEILVTVPGIGYRLVLGGSRPQPISHSPAPASRWASLYRHLLGRTETAAAEMARYTKQHRSDLSTAGLHRDLELLREQTRSCAERLRHWEHQALPDTRSETAS